jgi:hypothetical protein
LFVFKKMTAAQVLGVINAEDAPTFAAHQTFVELPATATR